ncbi:PilW family protein [Ottowia sp.]|uniref:PilW family protein n=1 Tax=Ottowia sp. TaxID=1898956 RepID=UPI0026164007|nr:PilW family protein [Ottowia sp.]
MSTKSISTLAAAPGRRQAGLTLVELLVAMVIGLLIAMVAVASLVAARRGAATVDAASQLRDDARFTTDIIQRLAVQTGFEDLASATAPYAGTAAQYKQTNKGSGGAAVDITTLQPNVYGFNNATVSASDPLNTASTRSAGDGGNGSDVLVLQYQTARNNINPAAGSASDGSMITCMGNSPALAEVGRNDRIYSVLSVDMSQGEPTLMCTTNNETTGVPYTQPLVKGVESFQVLYGVDNVTPGAALSASNTADSVPDSFLRADQLTVAGNQKATYANWRRVRSLRIGLVLRGPANSAQGSAAQTLQPFKGSDFVSGSDPGSSYTVTDSRLRQTVSFTVQLRNCQNQGFQSTTSTLACDVTLP